MGAHASTEPVRVVLDCVRRIVRALRESSREAERKVGVSGAQLFVLQQIASGQAGSVTELAERTLTHQSSVSVVVQRLAAAGLLARSRSSRDRRRTDLRLTARGRSLVSSAPPLLQERLIEAVRQLPPARRLGLAAALGEVVDRMQLPGGAAPMFFEDVRRAAHPRAASRSPRRRLARR
jgi:DNA-binding MarR family transcriptional regulator